MRGFRQGPNRLGTVRLTAAALALGILAGQALGFERMAGYQDGVVTVDEDKPCPALVTYDRSQRSHPPKWRHMVLGKLELTVREGEEVLALRDGGEVTSLPHGVRARAPKGDRQLLVTASPLIRGADTEEQDGGAAFRVEIDGPKDVDCELRYGGLGNVEALINQERREKMGDEKWPLAAEDQATARDGIAWLSAPDTVTWRGPLLVAAALIGPDGNVIAAQIETAPGGAGPCAVWRFGAEGPSGVLTLVAMFGESEETVEEGLRQALAAGDGGLEQSRTHFAGLIEAARIRTPAADIDRCFASALLNLEYTYYEGLGWIECLHHWVGFFQPVHTMAADALGQWDRSRAVLANSAMILSGEGRAMDFTPAGTSWHGFAWDQYFQWCIRHLWRATGNRVTLRALWPAVKRNMEYVRRTWDTDGNGLYGFDQQIGWQEDYVYSYEDSGSASLAFADIAQGIAEMARVLGDETVAEEYQALALRSRRALCEVLWETRLGRYVNNVDRLGAKHYEGQYHTFCWPGYLGLVDHLDAYTSARHLDEVLTTPRRLVYVSNNFPTHLSATVGCQEGSAQPAFAALALARQGWAGRCAEILEEEGKLVNGPPLSGSFPEVMGQGWQFPSWFSGPAAAYAQAVVEGLFGLERDLPHRRVELRPALPADWGEAEIELPWMTARFRQGESVREVRMRLAERLGVDLAWWLPVCRVKAVSDTGEAVGFTVEPGPGGVLVRAELPPAREHEIRIDFEPRAWRIEYEAEVAPGQEVAVRARGCRILGITDREGLSAEAELREGEARLLLREDLMRDFEPFGEWGRTQFLDRTLFLWAEAGGVEFYAPVDLTLGSGLEPSGRTSAQSAAEEPASPSQVVAAMERNGGYEWSDVELPEEALKPSEGWRQWRWSDDVGHQPWASQPDPLGGEKELVGDSGRIAVEGRTVSFAAPQGKVVPAGGRLAPTPVVVPVNKTCSAIAVLLLPLLYNEDVFSQVGEIVIRGHGDETLRQALYFPGDLDWMHAPEVVGDFATVGKGWSRSPAVRCKTAVMSVVEVPIVPAMEVTSVQVRAVGTGPCLAVVGLATLGMRRVRWEEVAGLRPADMPPEVILADFEDGTLEGWEVQGEAWGPSEAGGYFQRYGRGRYFADSRYGGEEATGSVRSLPFRIVHPWLTWLADGWRSGGLNYFRLVDAETGAVLMRTDPPDHTGGFPRLTEDVSKLMGRRVRFEAVDACTESAYAWLAFDELVMARERPR